MSSSEAFLNPDKVQAESEGLPIKIFERKTHERQKSFEVNGRLINFIKVQSNNHFFIWDTYTRFWCQGFNILIACLVRQICNLRSSIF